MENWKRYWKAWSSVNEPNARSHGITGFFFFIFNWLFALIMPPLMHKFNRVHETMYVVKFDYGPRPFAQCKELENRRRREKKIKSNNIELVIKTINQNSRSRLLVMLCSCIFFRGRLLFASPKFKWMLSSHFSSAFNQKRFDVHTPHFTNPNEITIRFFTIKLMDSSWRRRKTPLKLKYFCTLFSFVQLMTLIIF